MSHLNVAFSEVLPQIGDSVPPTNPSRHSSEVAVSNSKTTTRRQIATGECYLTVNDVRLLEEAVAINGGPNTPIGRFVADKLRRMELCATIPAHCVALNSHVGFSVNRQQSLSRVLVHWKLFTVPRLHLSLHHPWGIALLGLNAGSEAEVYWPSGTVEEVRVQSVAHT
ncbi:MAG: hypothetical protein ABJG14_06895 [Sulfitobacter sp.]|uniref:hypothetical protein n=2 Tax=Pseudomonadota TaxID=1224 RepID=UPI0032640E66